MAARSALCTSLALAWALLVVPPRAHAQEARSRAEATEGEPAIEREPAGHDAAAIEGPSPEEPGASASEAADVETASDPAPEARGESPRIPIRGEPGASDGSNAWQLSASVPAGAPRAARGQPSFGLAFRHAILGEFVAALPGALIGLVVGLTTCGNGEGWISGFTCFAGTGYAVTISAFAAAPLGAAVAIHHAYASRGAEGSFWAALGGAYAGAALGAGLSAIVIAAADEPTWAAITGGLLTAILAPVLGTLAYGATTSTRRGDGALLAPVLDVSPEGASLGLMGVL